MLPDVLNIHVVGIFGRHLRIGSVFDQSDQLQIFRCVSRHEIRDSIRPRRVRRQSHVIFETALFDEAVFRPVSTALILQLFFQFGINILESTEANATQKHDMPVRCETKHCD